MFAGSPSPRSVSKLLGLTAAFALATVATHLAATSSAFACGNVTEVVAQGLFPTMFLFWGAGIVSTVIVLILDAFRETPLTNRGRLMVGVAIVVMFSGIWTIYYGATTDYEAWRTWDKTAETFEAPVRGTSDVEF